MLEDRPSHSLAACARLLDPLLIEPQELLQALAPEGWKDSPLRPARGSGAEGVAGGAPVEPEQEIVDLLGCALWDVFSDGHAVVDAEGVRYDLGSFRGSADFIADSINRRYEHLRSYFNYMDFYMGSMGFRDRADLRPVYRWIFLRLKGSGCHWVYSFPRVYLVDMGALAADDGPYGHDPSAAVAAEIERTEREAESRDFEERLERAYRQDVERARHQPLPATVAAYRDVFGHLPGGWPHPEM